MGVPGTDLVPIQIVTHLVPDMERPVSRGGQWSGCLCLKSERADGARRFDHESL
jgi:hypothetical protein